MMGPATASSNSSRDTLMVVATIPERYADLLSHLDQPSLFYRHGPAFPTLAELISHVTRSATAVNEALHTVLGDGLADVSMQEVIDPPMSIDTPTAPPSELLRTYAEARARTMTLLDGLADERWDHQFEDQRLGLVSVREVCEMVMSHEVAHLSQARNLAAFATEPGDRKPLPSRPSSPENPAQPESEPHD